MTYLAYSPDTGEIVLHVFAPDDLLAANVPEDLTVIPGDEDPRLYRINLDATPHAAIAKTEIPYALDHSTISADGSDTATLSDIPAGVSAWFDGEQYDPTAGELSIVADLPGLYRIELIHPLYLQTVVEITAE